jgi:hypothetical protein
VFFFGVTKDDQIINVDGDESTLALHLSDANWLCANIMAILIKQRASVQTSLKARVNTNVLE